MKLVQFLLSVILISSFAHSAYAAKKSKKLVPPVEDQTIYNLPISQSEIKIIEVAPIEKKAHEFEFTASSWVPKNFNLPSYLSDSSDFGREGIPLVSVNYITKSFDVGKGGDVSSKFGLSYMSLDRTAPFSGSNAHETLNLFSIRIGAEYTARNLLPFNLEPALGLFILPTWIAASRTELDNGVSAYGFPVEGSIDLLYHSPQLSKLVGSSDLILGLGVHEVYGSLSGSDLSGLGVQGILRLRM